MSMTLDQTIESKSLHGQAVFITLKHALMLAVEALEVVASSHELDARWEAQFALKEISRTLGVSDELG